MLQSSQKKPSQNRKKKNEELALEELDRFMKCTSSSFDGNVLKISMSSIHCIKYFSVGSSHILFVMEESTAIYT